MPSVPSVNSSLSSWPLGAVSVWQKWTVANSSTNLLITNPDGSTNTVAKAAATTQSVTLLTPGVNFIALNAAIKSGTAFTGTSALVGTIGKTGALTGLVSVAYDLKAAVAVTNFGIPTLVPACASFNGTDAIILALTSTIDNISSISAGSVSIWVLLAYLP